MEVHAHTHTARKKWTHYLWEFLMLFLAVFCGFLAENQREHMIEHQREKILITEVVEDLITDYPFPNDVSIDLNDIPLTARINKTDPGFQNFIAKLKKYNFYLATSVKGEYIRVLKSLDSTMSVLKKEYHLE